MIQSKEDIGRIVNEWGFLPFFAGEIAGFSLEEMTPPHLWFPDEDPQDMGVWDMKSDIILEADCAYGKFYQKKACFVSMKFFPDLVNYRRTLHPLTPADRQILDTLGQHHSLLSRELKRLCGYTTPRQPRAATPLEKHLKNIERQAMPASRARSKAERLLRPSFDTAITRLQMMGYITSAAFEYSYDREGRRYGWGVARYCTPEDFFGPERMHVGRSPHESFLRLFNHLSQLLPQASDEQIRRIVADK